MPRKEISLQLTAVLAMLVATLFVANAVAQTETVLYNFNGAGTDGAGYAPIGGVIFDKAGNLYGATYEGGAYGNGTVYEVSPAVGGGWTEKVLHSFGSGNDGQYPDAGLIFDAAGNLYGATRYGGVHGYGTVFEIAPKTGGGWIEKVLHSFADNGKDGTNPEASLVLDAAGNLYGTTLAGGTYFFGTVFELSPAGGSWKEKVLHSFDHNGHDGITSAANLVMDAAGNLYGTTELGGAHHECALGCGTVFELSPTSGGGWRESVLHSFNENGTDGYTPYAGLIIDSGGNLYSTTAAGGAYNGGAVFELSPTGSGGWTESILYSFGTSSTDGSSPRTPLTLDSAGNLYGSTGFGGAYNEGTLFELTLAEGGGWTESILHNFDDNGTDGAGVTGSLILDATGNLYGATSGGGNADSGGTVFEMTP